jgi:hypothetical protein
MASDEEVVTIIIEAEDAASKKLDKVEDSIEDLVDSTKEAGSEAKVSAEALGALAGTLGGGVIGSFTGDIANLTDKVSALGDMAEEGGAKLKIFQGMAVMAAGAVGFKIGKAIGDWVFETAKWSNSISAELARLDKLGGEATQKVADRLADGMAEIELAVSDPNSSESEKVAKFTDMVYNEITGLNNAIASRAKKIKDLQTGWTTKNEEKIIEGLLKENDAAAQQLKLYNDQIMALKERDGTFRPEERAADMKARIDSEKEYMDALKQSTALEGASAREREIAAARQEVSGVTYTAGIMEEINAKQDQFKKEAEIEHARQKNLLDARGATQTELDALSVYWKNYYQDIEDGRAVQFAQATGADHVRMMAVEAEINKKHDLIDATKEQADEEKRAADQKKKQEAADKKDAADKQKQRDAINKTYDKEIESIKIRTLEETKGSAAAEAYKLVQQGMSKSAANELASAREEFKDLEKMKSADPAAAVSAVNSRLGTGASEEHKAAQLAQQSIVINTAQLKALNRIDKVLDKIEKEKALKLALVG